MEVPLLLLPLPLPLVCSGHCDARFARPLRSSASRRPLLLVGSAALLYDKITKPYIAPRVRSLPGKMKNIVTAIYQTLMNAVHLWLLWFIFIILPSSLKRMIAVAIGTIFPLISSITASTTEEFEDDTYWLTYRSYYGILIFTTVYLMLPMFQGADKVFRKILVPAAGLSELLLLRDAISVKKRMLEDLDTN